jgi:hypothetical protein
MPDDVPIVDCHECKDLAFARNLARQMKEGYGRHNSNRTWLDRNQTARVIGRLRHHSLRKHWWSCRIGDAVPESCFDDADILNGSGAIMAEKHKYTPRGLTVMMFERVSCQVTGDAGNTWHTQHYWKRLS